MKCPKCDGKGEWSTGTSIHDCLRCGCSGEIDDPNDPNTELLEKILIELLKINRRLSRANSH